MITAMAQLEAVRRAHLPNVEVAAACAWVFGCDYLVAAQPTRRGHFWEVTNVDAGEEIGGRFPSAIAAVRYALEQGPTA